MKKKSKKSMKDDFENELSKAINGDELLARKIWLAGIGAYSQAFDKMQGKYQNFNSESKNLVENLISHGEETESQAKKILSSTTDRIKETSQGKFSQVNENSRELFDRLVNEGESLEELLSSKKDGLLDMIESNLPDSVLEAKNVVEKRLENVRSKISSHLQLPPFLKSKEPEKKASKKKAAKKKMTTKRVATKKI